MHLSYLSPVAVQTHIHIPSNLAVNHVLTHQTMGGFGPIFQSDLRGGKTILFNRGIRNKKFCKVKNFQVWVD